MRNQTPHLLLSQDPHPARESDDQQHDLQSNATNAGPIADLQSQATLEEVVEADLLLHVIDASSPNAATQRQAVYDVLEQLGIGSSQAKQRVVEVWNKCDLVPQETASAEVSASEFVGDPCSTMSGIEHEPEADEDTGAKGGVQQSSEDDLHLESGRSLMMSGQDRTAEGDQGSGVETTSLEQREWCCEGEQSHADQEKPSASCSIYEAAMSRPQQDTVWNMIQVMLDAEGCIDSCFQSLADIKIPSW